MKSNSPINSSIFFRFGLRFSIICFILLSVLIIQTPTSSGNIGNQQPVKVSQNTYTEHAPIYINSPSDFTTLGFPGNGSLQNPYRIEGLNITSPDSPVPNVLIQIQSITSYFTINNNLLNGRHITNYGIALRNSYKGNITNNLVSNTIISTIHLYQSQSNFVMHNTVSGNEQFGSINLLQSTGNYILSNTAYSNQGNGFVLENSFANIVSDNIAYDNTDSGIHLTSGSSFNYFHNNTLYQNQVHGIFVGGLSNNNTIFENIVHNNLDGGIIVSEASDNFVISNLAHDNGNAGISLENSINNTVTNTLSYLNHNAEIQMINASYSTIEDNEVYENTYAGGIFVVESSVNNTFMGNSVHDNDVGIRFEAFSHNNTVVDNKLSDNNVGLHAEASSNLVVRYNTIHNNDIGLDFPVGDRRGFTSSCIVEANLFFDNSQGMDLNTQTNDNIIRHNDFAVSIDITDPQASDSGLNNLFEMNYWSDWTSGPYELSGSAGNTDNSPEMASNHLKLNELIVHGGEILSNPVDLSWDKSDILNHTTTASLSYSINGNENNWIQIADSIQGDSYNWDTSGITQGFGVNIKLEVKDEFGLEVSATSARFYLGFKDTTDPTIGLVTDTTITEGSTGTSLQWDAQDDNPWIYQITIDGFVLVEDASWEAGSITFSLDNLDPGTHGITLTIFDVSGNSATDTVMVTVKTEESPPPKLKIDSVSINLTLLSLLPLLLVRRRWRSNKNT